MPKIMPDRTPLFGVVVQDELHKWWGNGGVQEVLGSIACGDGKTGLAYPLGFVSVDTSKPVNWCDPLANPLYVLTYEPDRAAAAKPDKPVDLYGPAGLFANVAGKGRAGERERVDSLALEAQPSRFRPGDFPYGGWVRLNGRKAGASGLPGGDLDDLAVRKILAKIEEIETQATTPYVAAVGSANGDPRVKYMLTEGWVIDHGELVHTHPSTLTPLGFPSDGNW